MSPPAATAELLEDGGAAAVSDEFFRSREFLAAERATHTLRIETADGEALVAPLLVHEIEGTAERDAISPYGYPGLVPSASGRSSSRDAATTTPASGAVAGLDRDEIDWSGTGLVSVFLRHTLDPPPLAGTTERNVVQVADPALPPKSRPSDRRQVRRNLEAGYELRLVPGAETSAAERAGFLDLYEQTMRRAPPPPTTSSAPPTSTASSPPSEPGWRSRPLRTASSPPPRSPRSATATCTTTSPAAPTAASARHR